MIKALGEEKAREFIAGQRDGVSSMPLLMVRGLVTRDSERDFHVVDVDLPGNQRKHCLYRSQSQTTPNDPNPRFS